MSADSEQKHTVQIQEIIGDPPTWMLRWGITVVFVILVLILIMAETLTYPDVIKAKMEIRTLNPPSMIKVKSPGTLIKLLVRNNQEVKIGQELAVVKSAEGQIPITATSNGKIIYAGIIHEQQLVSPEKSLFQISGKNEVFWGEMDVSTKIIDRVKTNQEVIVKLNGAPDVDKFVLHGRIKYITINPNQESEYIAEIVFNGSELNFIRRKISLNQGIKTEAFIITQNTTLFKRLTKALLKNIWH